MLYAIKGNKQLKIDETQKAAYLAMDYDIAKDVGDKLEVIQHAPGKTVPYAKYEELLQENAALKAKLAAAEKKAKGTDKQRKEAASDKK